MTNAEIIYKYFDDFTPTQQQQFEMLHTIYKEWNNKINVVSRKDIDEIYLHHVLHSLSIATIVKFSSVTQVVDIGCGGGFPGVPLAIFFPNTSFHLVDSIGKKLTVVNEVCNALNIKNITTQHTRIEEIKNRKFDFAISRAVAPLKDLWFWAKPLLNAATKTNIPNSLICLKGGDLHLEISESNTRPRLIAINEKFEESYFNEKYIVQVAR